MTHRVLLSALLSLGLLSACSSAPATTGPHATLKLRDGSTVGGMVTSSSATEIQIAADDKSTRTIPMSQVRSVDYDDAAPAGATPTLTPGLAPARAAAKPAHENHYHPTAAVVTTKTCELTEGTEISVRSEETIDSEVAVEGQTFAAEVTENLKDAAGDIVIPDRANATIVIVSASKGGRFHDASDLVLDLGSVSIDGKKYQLSTVDLVERGKEGVGGNSRTAKFVGGGAAIGKLDTSVTVAAAR